MIFLSEFVGIKPPAEIKLMLRFNELKSLTLDKLNNRKIIKLSKE